MTVLRVATISRWVDTGDCVLGTIAGLNGTTQGMRSKSWSRDPKTVATVKKVPFSKVMAKV